DCQYRTALQDRLVSLCFQAFEVIGRKAERSEQNRRPRQVALGLSNSRLQGEHIYIVRYDIENLINLSQSFRETATDNIGSRLLREHLDVARPEPLGFLKIGFAPIPLAAPARDIG